MNRRAHKKSRNGCIECKRRHIKCDETRPTCRNCNIIERDCVYRTKAPPTVSPDHDSKGCPQRHRLGTHTPPVSSGSSPYRDGTSTGNTDPAPRSTNSAGGSPSACPDPPGTRSGPTVNMNHMELLVNFSLDLIIMELGDDLRESGTKVLLKAGVEAPYLMHEMMSLSALHLSHARPERKQYYMEQSVQLQTEAISLFNTTKPEVDGSNCVPIAMFSSMLGRHLCIEALATCNSGLDSFLDSYLNFARLRQRGAFVIQSVRLALEESELRPLLTWGPGIEGLVPEGHDCDGLQALISSSSLDDSYKAACRRAVELIQVAYDNRDRRKCNPTLKHMVRIIFTWAFMVPDDFIEMLSQRRPEAIAVLGYHTVILYLARDIWQVGDAGVRLLRIIGEHLGPEWEEWLAWPRSIVLGDG
ncbi:C6 finger domain-containing protein [Colletotrichum truncatum]|uniref:C6 finger domain-containing protein n=1 Tax=Colletotrichum truncatum TaxID=5467 RepID=A0ACC3YIK9_COLTU|nr:C6 finger domain-containing protein [Colletotrichum truncatum]KAF6794435.1 C6 finger domain-containing protein [Colletotrichum truncatum]